MLFLDNESSKELTISPKAFRYAPKANSKQKCMNTTQEHEKGTLLQGYSPWRADLLVVASKHCSLSCCSSPWRTDGEHTLLSSLGSPLLLFLPKTSVKPNLPGSFFSLYT